MMQPFQGSLIQIHTFYFTPIPSTAIVEETISRPTYIPSEVFKVCNVLVAVHYILSWWAKHS